MSEHNPENGELTCPFCSKKFKTTRQAIHLPSDKVTADNETISINLAESDKISQSAISDSTIADSLAKKNNNNETTIPKRIGNYTILSEVARGGMGIVYLAEQPNLKRIVALKVLRAGDGATEEDLSRFMREAKAAASLSHQNIVPIHDLRSETDPPFFTMDYIEGKSLEQIINDGKLTPRESVKILEQLALAVDYAHSNGIVHRDLKPANVIITPDGIPKITDFGLAVNLARDPERERMTHSGVVMGTIPYIPPEQAAGEVDSVGPKSDVYSLGAILFEMITGKPPFEGNTQFELLHSVLHKDPPLPRKLNPRIPPDLQTICMKCLEKPASRRYENANDLAEDCRRFLDGEVITARPATIGYRIIKTVTRYKALSSLVAGIIILTITFFAITSSLEKRREQVEQQRHETQIKLIKETKRADDQEKKIEELTASLDPGWKQSFYENFSAKKELQNWYISEGRGVLRRGYLVLSTKPPENDTEAAGKNITSNITFKKLVVGDCRLEFKLYFPKTEGYSLHILVSGTGRELSGNFGYLFKIGTPTDAGAKIDKGPVTMAEAPNAVITPEKWHFMVIERSGNKLSMEMDGKIIIEAIDESPFINDEHKLIGFALKNGYAYIDDLRIFRPGNSQQMMASMLEMADNFFQHNNLSWAIQMSEYVANESSDLNLFMRALRRIIKSYLRQSKGAYAKAKPFADRLIQSLIKSPEHKFLSGEDEYIYGILAKEARDYPTAINHFDAAAGLMMNNDNSDIYILLSHLESLLVKIKNDQIEESVILLTKIQRSGILKRIAYECRDILSASDINSTFLAEVDRLLEINKLDFAWNFLEALRTLFPETNREIAGRYIKLAGLYEANGFWNEAKALYETAQNIAPEWEDPLLELGEAYVRNNNERKALSLFEQTAIDFPNSAKAQMRLANFLLYSNERPNPQRAIELAIRAVELTEGQDAGALDLLADSYLAVGEGEQAYLALINAQELSPSFERQSKIDEITRHDLEY